MSRLGRGRRIALTLRQGAYPDANEVALIAWAELEIPELPRSGEVAFAEFEIPDASRTIYVAFAQLRIPDVVVIPPPDPRRVLISWAELRVRPRVRPQRVGRRIGSFYPSPWTLYPDRRH